MLCVGPYKEWLESSSTDHTTLTQSGQLVFSLYMLMIGLHAEGTGLLLRNEAAI